MRDIDNIPAANDFIQEWDNKITIAKDALLEAQRQQTNYANEHRRYLEFNIGDKVLLSTRNIEMPVDKQRSTRKLSPRYCGLYTIIEKISPLVYKLELPTTLRIHPVFYISMLKTYHEDVSEFERQTLPSPIENVLQQDEYEVEDVLDKRTIRKKMQYLIKWKGYSLHDATWEPREHLENAQDAVNRFESIGH